MKLIWRKKQQQHCIAIEHLTQDFDKGEIEVSLDEPDRIQSTLPRYEEAKEAVHSSSTPFTHKYLWRLFSTDASSIHPCWCVCVCPLPPVSLTLVIYECSLFRVLCKVPTHIRSLLAR